MSKLYLCNTTRQKWHASFRVPEVRHPYFVAVPPGSQVLVDENIGQQGLEEIVKQIEFYGGRDASTVNGKLEEFSGYFYRWDKPIQIDDIHAGHAAVLDNADKRAANAAETSVMAFDMSQRDKSGERLASETEIAVTEEVPVGQKPTGDEVKSKFTVAPDGQSKLKLGRN